MTEKATARAHPIQGLVKYHGMRDPELRLPYHDSISLCTAPTATTTTVEWQPDASEDVYVIGDEEVDGRAAERIDMVVEHVRELAGVDAAVRLESENSFRRTSASARRRPGSRPPRSRSPRPLASTSLYRISPPSPVAAPPPRPVR